MMNSKKEDRELPAQSGHVADILDPNNQIGIRLRSLYAAVQEEVIPDRFLDLLEKLDHVERLATVQTGKE